MAASQLRLIACL